MSCDNEKRQIIVPLEGIPGPQGEQGPAGVPGASVQLPIDAIDVSVANDGYDNLQEVLNFLLYDPIVINSFSTPVDIFEIGVTVTSLTFNWVLNYNPIIQTLTGPLITAPTLVPGDRTSILSVDDMEGSSPGDTFNYTLEVNDGTNTIQAIEGVKFYNGVYVGDAEIPGSVNSAFINTLNKTLQLNKNRTWTSTASGSQYAWACWRKALGLATFTVGSFTGGFEAPTTVSHTNDSGFTEDYYVARSSNPAIGPVTISIS